MKDYLKAEILKTKRSVLLKVALIVPLVASGIAVGFNAMGGEAATKYDVETIVDHWALIWLPLLITLIAGLLNNHEMKSTNYRMTFSLDINLLKKEFSKSLVVTMYVCLSSFILALILMAVHFSVKISPSNVTLSSCIWGVFVILIVSLWQIPFWLVLSRKLNFYFCIILNTGLSLELGSRFAMSDHWYLVPWAWPLKVQMPFTNLYANGLPILESDLTLNSNFLIGIILLAIAIYVVISYIDALHFSKMEVK